MVQRKVQRMSKLTVKKIESLIKNRIFGRHSDGNQLYLNRSMFGLDGSSLTAGTAASDAVFSDSDDLLSRINTLGDLADIDGSGDIDALTDGLLILRYLFGLEGETLVAGVVSNEATRTTEEIEAHLKMLMP
jgi:hypothetical protein